MVYRPIGHVRVTWPATRHRGVPANDRDSPLITVRSARTEHARSLGKAGICQDALMRPGRPTLGAMTATREDGQQPVVPLPERDPAALRAAVAKLDTAALAKFESDWTAATARARDEYSMMPARYFVEHWWTWVAVERWPALAARLRDCERIVAESADRNARRAAAAEISEILRRAESATT